MRLAVATLAAAMAIGAIGAVESRFTTTVSGASRFDAAPVFAPRVLTPPSISGDATDGETLTATTGTWARSPQSLRVEWLRCEQTACVKVGEGAARELVAEDVGARMRTRVVATNAGGSTTV